MLCTVYLLKSKLFKVWVLLSLPRLLQDTKFIFRRSWGTLCFSRPKQEHSGGRQQYRNYRNTSQPPFSRQKLERDYKCYSLPENVKEFYFSRLLLMQERIMTILCCIFNRVFFKWTILVWSWIKQICEICLVA